MKFDNSLKEMAFDLLQVHEHYAHCHENIEFKCFWQTWPSTSLGFSKEGKDSLTTATTIVVFKGTAADVYFGGKVAYRCPKAILSPQFMADVKNEAMAPVSLVIPRYSVQKA